MNKNLKITKTIFPKKEFHIPKWILINAVGKTLGRLASEISKLLRGKDNCFFTPSINQGNFVVVLNADKIIVTGKKLDQKLYRRNSGRPGSLKTEKYRQLKDRVPCRIIENAVWGMLPKGIIGRMYYRRLFVYTNNEIKYNRKFEKSVLIKENWIEANV